jgi:hypothetical protein
MLILPYQFAIRDSTNLMHFNPDCRINKADSRAISFPHGSLHIYKKEVFRLGMVVQTYIHSNMGAEDGRMAI